MAFGSPVIAVFGFFAGRGAGYRSDFGFGIECVMSRSGGELSWIWSVLVGDPRGTVVTVVVVVFVAFVKVTGSRARVNIVGCRGCGP